VTPERLIEELVHNATASGNRTLERRLSDLAVWFYRNKSRIPLDNLASRQAFLQKGFWIMLEINALLLERLREVEASGRGSKSPLWLPKGMRMDDREFA
jgi:hypothetical protein